MKPSRFNFMVPSPRDPNVVFLYNSLSDNRIAIENNDVNLPELLKKVERHDALNTAETEASEQLKELGYLLEDQDDEEAAFKQWFNGRVKEQNEILSVTILTTLACNLRCTYCYEKDQLGNSRMSPEMVEQTILWLKQRIEQTHPRKLNIIYFGGEPLLNLHAIRKIGQEIFPFCRERDIEFSSGMATNGILLTPELVDELKQYGFQWIKITFDGDQCEHDRRRIYKGGKGTFDEIFRKLESVAGKLRILLGGNFDPESADSFKGLLDKIAASNFKDDVAAANFKPILPEIRKRDLNGIGSSCERCTYTDFDIQKMLELRQETRAVGLKPTDPINSGPCEFYRRNAVTIGIDGTMYKCIAFVGIKGTEIGHVKEAGFNQVGEAMLNASRPFQHSKCSKCAFPPICGGGCRADAYNTTGSFENISCQQEYFKKTIAAELPAEYYDGVESARQMGGV